jgi:outer membrane lipase/esterase
MRVNRVFRALRNGVLVLAMMGAVSSAAVASYSQVYFFGDSLTDTGNLYANSGGMYPVSPPYYNGGFSNGPLWSQTFANALGFSSTPAALGGNNFAWAGATIIDYGRPQPEIPQQLGMYLGATGGGADPNALYVIMGGGNDINDVGADPATAVANIIAAANAINDMVNSLYFAGARNILVGNLPDIGLTPLALAGGPAVAAGATALSQLFNATLSSLLAVTEAANSGIDIDLLDMYALLNDAVANAASYGFGNVTSACKEGELGLPGAVCSDPDAYLFWDSFHPSARAHDLIAQTALRAIPEPAAILLFAVALLALLCMAPAVHGRKMPLPTA